MTGNEREAEPVTVKLQKSTAVARGHHTLDEAAVSRDYTGQLDDSSDSPPHTHTHTYTYCTHNHTYMHIQHTRTRTHIHTCCTFRSDTTLAFSLVPPNNAILDSLAGGKARLSSDHPRTLHVSVYHAGLPPMSGWLKRRTTSASTGIWGRLFFRTNNQFLNFFVDDAHTVPDGSIDLRHVSGLAESHVS